MQTMAGITGNNNARKANWGAEEKDVLCSLCHENEFLLSGKADDPNMSFQRTKFWNRVTESVNSVGGACRTAVEVKKKWSDVKSSTKKKLVTINRERGLTGGGPPPQASLSEWEMKVAAVIPKSSVQGVTGGADVFMRNNSIVKQLTSTPNDSFEEGQCEAIVEDNSSVIDVQTETPPTNLINPVLNEVSSCGRKRKMNINVNEQLLQIEREKLETLKKMNESLSKIASLLELQASKSLLDSMLNPNC